MTLSSSVQRYNNSCVIPKSYEQKKVATPVGIATLNEELNNVSLLLHNYCLSTINGLLIIVSKNTGGKIYPFKGVSIVFICITPRNVP